jgi:tetratricopeptide (TPR) repeat protein
MSNLAIVLSKQGDWEEAHKLHEEVLEARRRAFGSDHPETCNAMYNLAGLFSLQNQWGRARKLYEQVLEVQRRILESDHPDTLMTMNNFANVLGEQGQLEEARKLHEEVLETRWQTLGPCHLSTLGAMENLILMRKRQLGSTRVPGFPEQIKESLRRGEDISPNVFFLATAHWHLGDKEEARRWYDKAVDWMDKHKSNDKDLARFRAEAAKLIGSESEDKSVKNQED